MRLRASSASATELYQELPCLYKERIDLPPTNKMKNDKPKVPNKSPSLRKSQGAWKPSEPGHPQLPTDLSKSQDASKPYLSCNNKLPMDHSKSHDASKAKPCLSCNNQLPMDPPPAYSTLRLSDSTHMPPAYSTSLPDGHRVRLPQRQGLLSSCGLVYPKPLPKIPSVSKSSKLGKKGNNRGEEITKRDVSAPRDFKHIQHFGFDCSKKFDEMEREEMPQSPRSVKEGYLWKRGEHIKNWRRRYYVLCKGGSLLGFRQKPDRGDTSDPSNSFNVKGCQPIEVDRPRPNSFVVVERLFSVDSKEEREEWIAAIRSVSDDLKVAEDAGAKSPQDINNNGKINSLDDPDMRRLLRRMGLDDSEEVDKDTADFMANFVEKRGGVEAVRKELEQSKQLQAALEGTFGERKPRSASAGACTGHAAVKPKRFSVNFSFNLNF